MRQLLIKTGLLLFVVLVAVSCDENNEEEIGYGALPQKARQFIARYFPDAEYTRIVRDKNDSTTEYKTWFSDDTKPDFDKQGDWANVDCKFSALPKDILPEVVVTDIATRYPGSTPYKMEKQPGGYEIDIPGWELCYNYQGTFVCAEGGW